MAAISLAVIAITLIIGLVEIGHALSTTQTAVEQLQQQIQQLRQGLTGLGGLLGG